MPYKDPEKRKEYNKQYLAKRYKENHAEELEKRAAYKEGIRVFIRNQKAGKKCCKCGESHPACLDFHHRNPEDKSFMISRAIKEGAGKDRIIEEIAKCDLLCRNCHAKEHWADIYESGDNAA